MRLSPRQSPPPGATPGPPPMPSVDPAVYEHPPLLNDRSSLVAMMVTFIVFSWICCLLRFYARFWVLRKPGWDDFFLALTMASTTAGSVMVCVATDYGYGRSIYTLSLDEIQALMRIVYIGGSTYPLSVTCIKLALLFQYLRIFAERPRYRLLCRVMLVLSTVWGLVFAALTWVPCWPVHAYWDFSVRDARCWGLGSHNLGEFMRVFVSQAITTAVLDFIVFVIPARLYFQPDTDRWTRFSLLGLFVLGLTVNLCSIWRMVYVIKLFVAAESAFDPTWYSPTTAALACFEVHLAAVCAALPVFWPVLQATWNRIFVTYEVSVTQHRGVLPASRAGCAPVDVAVHARPRPYLPGSDDDVELQSAASSQAAAADSGAAAADAKPPLLVSEGWEPYVGDEKTGLGENETVVRATKTKRRRILRLFGL